MKKKSNNKFELFMSKVFVFLSIVVALTILVINVLPFKYLALFLAIDAFICLVLRFFLTHNKIKKGIKNTSLVISILLSIVYIFVIYYALRTYGFMSNVNNIKDSYRQYYIISLKDSGLNKNNINNLDIEMYDDNTSGFDEFKEKIEKEYKLNTILVNSVNEMYEDLINEEVSLIAVNSISKDYLESNNKDFIDSINVIDTVKIKIKTTKKSSKKIDILKDTFTVYISGIDTYGSIDTTSRSDVNMLATVNAKNGEILLTSIPRDYYVKIDEKSEYNDKLTHAGIYGVDTSIKAIEDLLDIKIDYHVRVNFSSAVDVIDLIGGVDVYSDLALVPWTNQKLYIEEGINHMDGDMALAFARERFSYSTGDVHRVQNQQDVLMAIIDKMTSSSTLLTKYTQILDEIEDSFETDIEFKDLASLVRNQLDKNPKWNIKRYILNGEGSSEYTYSMPDVKAYVMIPDIDTVIKANSLITGMIEGKKLSELGL